MEDNTLHDSKIKQKFYPHVHLVGLSDGSKKILKYPHEGNNSDTRLKELICELSVSELLAYGGIYNEPRLYFNDADLCIEKDDYEYSWSEYNSNPTIEISNADQLPLAFVIDWVTEQQDRWKESLENARLQKLESGRYIFAPTDNGNCLKFNGDWKPEENLDSGYTSRLLFSSMIKSKEELLTAIELFKTWPIKKILFDAITKLFNCGSTFSEDKQEFILNFYIENVNFIEIRKLKFDNLVSWFETAHQQPEIQEDQVAPVN